MVRRNKQKVKTDFCRKPRTKMQAYNFSDAALNEHSNATSFDFLHLNRNLMKGIHEYGLEKPAGIQKNGILPCVRGRDVILQAQSGMGKTAAFCIGSLQQINVKNPVVQVLVVAPTRELADQIQSTFLSLGRHMNIGCITCIGGTSLRTLKEKLQRKVHIVVGTPGQLINLLRRKLLNLDTLKTLIIDESDKMLTGSFTGDMKELIAEVNGNAQIILSSATMPSDAQKVARKIMYKPLAFLLDNTELTLEGIKQFYIKVDREMDKLETLVDLYPIIAKSRTMIFASTRDLVELIRERLLEMDIDIPITIGTFCQDKRNKTLAAFRNSTQPVILATDLLGRGIDIQQVYAVINFDLPYHTVDYIHRIGRCGRYGRKGIAINLVNEEEKSQLDEIAEYFATDINEMSTDISKYF